MKIGKNTVPRTAISTSDEHTIVVRGQDLSSLIGGISFTDYFYLLLTGQRPGAAARAVLDQEPALEVEYLELTDSDLGPPRVGEPGRLLVAARLGTTRLIDNVPVAL